jgi:homeobox protein cut-like
VLDFWKEFDLDGRRLVLDKTCIEVREAKTSSINGRKRLNELTKSFRAKPREEQLNAVSEVLKAYQDEIDQLSRRSKLSESAFYGLYKSIFEAPDPAIAIEGLITMVTSSSTYQLEIQRLESELKQYDEEFQQLKNQDITIRRLEDQIQEFKDSIEDKVAEAVALRTVEIEELSESKIGEIQELQKMAEKRLAAAVESMKAAQLSADRAQGQLYEISSQGEIRINALIVENQMLGESSERYQSRIGELESEVQNLRTSASLMKHTSPRKSSSSDRLAGDASGSLDTENTETLYIVINDLRKELAEKQEAARSARQTVESSLRETTQHLARERDQLAKTRQELAERPTFDDLLAVKRQLRMLQRVAFNVEEDDDEDCEGSTSNTNPENTAEDGKAKRGSCLDEKSQLEILLAQRMKSLETELSEARRALREAKQQEISSKDTISTLKKSLETSNALVVRLEADLESQTKGARVGGGGRGRGADGKGTHAGSGGGAHGNTDLAELLGVDLDDTTQEWESSRPGSPRKAPKGMSTSGVGTGAGMVGSLGKQSASSGDGNNSGNQQMITILQSQRDRYKERLGTIEQQVLSLQQQVKQAQDSKHQLEADNLELYGKIRFLQNYKSGSSGSHLVTRMDFSGTPSKTKGSYGNSYGCGHRTEEFRSNDDGLDYEEDIEARYHSLYEQRMNPFAEFSQHEKQRKLKELNVADRIVLNTVLAFISNQTGRTLVVAYLGAMHLLVFIVLYYVSHHVHHGCDPSLDHTHHYDHAEVDASHHIASGITHAVAAATRL